MSNLTVLYDSYTISCVSEKPNSQMSSAITITKAYTNRASMSSTSSFDTVRESQDQLSSLTPIKIDVTDSKKKFYHQSSTAEGIIDTPTTNANTNLAYDDNTESEFQEQLSFLSPEEAGDTDTEDETDGLSSTAKGIIDSPTSTSNAKKPYFFPLKTLKGGASSATKLLGNTLSSMKVKTWGVFSNSAKSVTLSGAKVGHWAWYGAKAGVHTVGTRLVPPRQDLSKNIKEPHVGS